MNSFSVFAVGNLAREPETVSKGSTSYTKFCLVGNDYAGRDGEGERRELVTLVWFVAFGAMGEYIGRNSRKGDQLIIDAKIGPNNWTDQRGSKHYDHSYVVTGFRFGAKGRATRQEGEDSTSTAADAA